MVGMIDNALPVGYDVAGYLVQRVIGRGGFGITYEGVSPITKKRVVIKEFFPHGIASRAGATVIAHVDSDDEREIYHRALQKFEETTTILCGIRHPNVVEVHHYLPAASTGYMIMEFLDGETIADVVRMRPNGTLRDIREVAAIFIPVLEALAVVHGHGVVHRDVSPDNIILERSGRPVLIDFGAAKNVSLGRGTSLIVAKRNYSPPEQTREDVAQVGFYSDVFSVAATLYEVIAGESAPPAEDRIWRKKDSYVPLADKAKIPCPKPLAAMIDRCLNLEIEKRPQTVEPLLAVLRQAALAGSSKPGLPRTAARTRARPARGFALLGLGLVPVAIAAAGWIALRPCGLLSPCEDPAARREAARVEEARRFQEAAADPTKLRSYAEGCVICEFQDEARRKADDLERAALVDSEAQRREERRAAEAGRYAATAGDVARLRTYAESCVICQYLDQARAEIEHLTKGGPAR